VKAHHRIQDQKAIQKKKEKEGVGGEKSASLPPLEYKSLGRLTKLLARAG